MRTVLIKYGHEASLVLLAIWAAIGTAGQNGLMNLLANQVSLHPRWSLLLTIANLLIASGRVPPSQRATT